VQTCPLAQHEPLQQPGEGQPVCVPFVALAVPHWLLVHVATLHTGGAGQLVDVVHCTHAPLEQTPVPPPLSVQVVPFAALAVPHVLLMHVATLQTGGAGQVPAATQPTHAPFWQTCGAAQLVPG
jgi:hypothetical protein